MLPEQNGGAATPAQPAPSATPVLDAFLGGSAPKPEVQADAPATPEEPKAAEATPPEPKQSPLADAIKRQREEREKRQLKQAEDIGYKRQLEELRAENEKLKKYDDPIADPVGWARARKMTREEQLVFGQSLLYDLAPDKTPTDFRQRMFEAKVEREKKAEREAAERQAQEQAKAQAQADYQGFVASVEDAVSTFAEGSYPESEAWFDGDGDAYIGELISTARRLADAATKAGRLADLSPGALASALEADIEGRIKRRDSRRQSGGTQKQQATQVAGGKQPASGETASTQGLGAGAPRQPAQTEAERVARAAEAMFRTR